LLLGHDNTGDDGYRALLLELEAGLRMWTSGPRVFGDTYASFRKADLQLLGDLGDTLVWTKTIRIQADIGRTPD